MAGRRDTGYDMAVAGAYICSMRAAASSPSIASRASFMELRRRCVEFDWQGNDEMEAANGDGWAELQDDGSLKGEICLLNGNDIPFIARRSKTSSTAC